MAKLILKSSFMNKKSHASNLISYISTRDGVELNNIDDNDIVTEKQLILINSIIEEFEFIKNSESFRNFEENKTKKNASIFLSDSIETLESQMMNKEIYMKYISERPNVEKFEEHGLFNQNGFANLEKELEEIKNHEGIVWANIISLKREDAIETGYDNAVAFQKLIASKSREISELMNISYKNFVWNGAFHNEGNHPHIHLVCYSKNPEEGFLKKENIKEIKKIFTQEIFRRQFLNIEKEKDKYRSIIREEFREVVKKNYSIIDTNNKFILMNSMKSEKRNYYKYQDKKVKSIIRNEVREIINSNPQLIENFNNFKECEKNLMMFYTEKNLNEIDNISLENHEEFKSIFRNAILLEVTKNKNNLLKDYDASQVLKKTKESIEKDFFNNLYLQKNNEFIQISKGLSNVKNNYFKYQNESLKNWIDEYINKKSNNNFLSNSDRSELRNFILEELTKIKLNEMKNIQEEIKLDFKNKFTSLHNLNNNFEISKSTINEISKLEKNLLKEKKYLDKEENFLSEDKVEELKLSIEKKEKDLKQLINDYNQYKSLVKREEVFSNLEEKLKHNGKDFIESNIDKNLKNEFEEFNEFGEVNIKNQFNNLNYELNRLRVKSEILKIDELFKIKNQSEDFFSRKELNNLLSNLTEQLNLNENKTELCSENSLVEVKKIAEVIKKELAIEKSLFNNKFLNSYLENKILQKAIENKKELIINIKSNIENKILFNVKDTIFFARKVLGEENKILNEIKFNEKTISNLLKQCENLETKKYKNSNLENKKLEKINDIKEEIQELQEENITLNKIINTNKFNPKYKIIEQLELKSINKVQQEILDEIKNDNYIENEFLKYKKLLNLDEKNFLDDKNLKNSITNKLIKNLEGIKIYNQKFHARNESLFLKETLKNLFDENNKLIDKELQKNIRKISSKISTLSSNSYFSQNEDVKKDIKELTKKLLNKEFNTSEFSKNIREVFERYRKNSNTEYNLENDEIFKGVLENKLYNLIIEEKKKELKNILNKNFALNDELNSLNSKNFLLNEDFSKDLFDLSKILKSKKNNIYEFQDDFIKGEVNKILYKILNDKYSIAGSDTSKNINKIYEKYLNGSELKLEDNIAFKNMLCNKILENATKIKRDFYNYEDYKNEINNLGKNLCNVLSSDLFKMTKEEQEGEFLLKSINKRLEGQAKAQRKKRSHSITY